MKPSLGRAIRELMDEANIKSGSALADKINAEAMKAGLPKLVSSSSVNKWLSDETQPKATSLMFLAKALNVSADLILFGDSDNPDQSRQLTKMVTAIVQAETKKLLQDGAARVKSELEKVLSSDKIPDEDKEALIRQARNLLKLYGEEDK